MITLVQLPAAWGLSSLSPFCVKLETWLRMARVPYAVRYTPMPFGAPKGKVPYIEDDGVKLGDSSLIIEHLGRKHGAGIDDGLSADERAQALLLQRTIEEHLYFCVLWAHWSTDEGWRRLRPVLAGAMPPVVAQLVPSIARAAIRKQLWQQGVARHAPAEVFAMGAADIHAVGAALGDREWFFGRPTTLDAVAYAFMSNVRAAPFEPLREALAAHASLGALCDRMQAAYWAPN